MANVYRLTSERGIPTFGMNTQDALFVASGSVQVFVARRRGNATPTIHCLTECPSGTLLPVFSFVEADDDQWDFELKAGGDEAVVECRANTSTQFLKRRFLQSCALPCEPAESFEGCLMNWLTKQEMQEVHSVIEIEKQKQRNADEGMKIIKMP